MTCTDTPGFVNAFGGTCAKFVNEGHCANGGMVAGHEWAAGASFGYPERHCCACQRLEGSSRCARWKQLTEPRQFGAEFQEKLLQAMLHRARGRQLRTLCELNAGTTNAVAASFLSHHPAAKYRGLAFSPNATELPSSQQRCQWPASGGEILFGDVHRSVLSPAAADITNCDALLVQADEVASRENTLTLAYNIVRGLPDAIRRLRRDGPRLLIMHGSAAARNTLPPPGWGIWWDQLAEAGLLNAVQCETTEGRTWCAGSVGMASICDSRPPLLAGPESTVPGEPPVVKAEVQFDVRDVNLKNWRYFTMFPCNPSAGEWSLTCMAYKTGRDGSVVVGLSSMDGLHFKRPSLIVPERFGPASMVHNLALAPHQAGFLVAGGITGKGIHLARSGSWRYAKWRHSNLSLDLQETVTHAPQWSRPRPIIDGFHPGCVEKRIEPWLNEKGSAQAKSRCEYDGRLALVSWPERRCLLLYARANPALKGQRFVHVSRSDDDGVTWGAFEMLDFRDYRYQTGNIYFFAAQVNPLRPDTLLAFFPLEHAFGACICMAASRDGVRWSTIVPVLPCGAAGERPTSHPMFGLAKSGRLVHLYIHENVPDILHEMPLTDDFYERFPYLRSPQPRVVRYEFSVTLLRAWTHESLSLLSEPAAQTATCSMPQLSPTSGQWNAYVRWLYGDRGDRVHRGRHLPPSASDVTVVHVRMFSEPALGMLVRQHCNASSGGLWACGSQAFAAKVNVHVPAHFAWRLGGYGKASAPHTPAANNAWVEVTHCAGSKFEQHEQPWFYVARGSGMFISVGQTIAFGTHQEGVRHFLGKGCASFECDHELVDMTSAASRTFDSIQFTRHCDGSCGLCQHELVMLRAGSRNGADSPCHKGIEYRRGLAATLPCTCAAASVSSYRRGSCAVCSEVLQATETLFPWHAPQTSPGPDSTSHLRGFLTT